MMKKMLFYFAAVAAVLSSCIKETPTVDETPVVEERVITITATAPTHTDANSTSNNQKPASANTRTQLVNGSSVMWCPGDVVKVCFEPPYSTASSNTQINHEVLAELTAVNSESSTNAMFTGTWN